MENKSRLKSIRTLLLIFIICLFISGLTAIPVHTELGLLEQLFPTDSPIGFWIIKVHAAYIQVNEQHPFLLYGYDWLAFAHFILSILFIGILRDPIKNTWVIQFGMISCVLIIPFAFTAGYFRGIPIGWRLIDCSFGIVGFLLLQMIMWRIKKMDTPLTNISIA
jgi:hypothetical protein